MINYLSERNWGLGTLSSFTEY